MFIPFGFLYRLIRIIPAGSVVNCQL